MKKIFLLLLPLLLFADIKFASSAAFDEKSTAFAEAAAVVVEKELGIELIKNTKSEIYVDEAALYALKNGIIKFTMLRKKLFEEIGLEYSNLQNYGFEPLFANDDIVLLAESRFITGFSSAKKANLQKQLKELGKQLKN
ncbi:MAG: hypothetical protein PHE67_06595 [Campylobacterales bacterium]|nr:hypothetical protein [Campylobacterales bacterium]